MPSEFRQERTHFKVKRSLRFNWPHTDRNGLELEESEYFLGSEVDIKKASGMGKEWEVAALQSEATLSIL